MTCYALSVTWLSALTLLPLIALVFAIISALFEAFFLDLSFVCVFFSLRGANNGNFPVELQNRLGISKSQLNLRFLASL